MSAPLFPLEVRHASEANAIGAAILTLTMAVGGVLMLFYVTAAWFMLIFALGALAMAVFFARDGIAGWTHVTTYAADSVTVKDAFGSHRFMRADIEGWMHIPPIAGVPRVELRRKGSAKPLFIHASVPKGKEIHPAIVAWFEGLPDLEHKKLVENIRDVQADEDFGHTPDERLKNAVREGRIVGVLTLLAIGVTLWLFAWPKPYWTAIFVGVGFPIAIVLLTALRRDRWRIDRGEEDVRPQTGWIILCCGVGLSMRAFFDWRIVDVALLLGIVAVFSLAAVALVAVVAREEMSRGKFLVWMSVAAIYGYGAIAPLNHWFDPARAQEFRAVVEEKHDSAVRIGPWGPIRQSREESVGPSALQSLEVGGEACVTMFRGALYVRSYFVDPCEAEADASSE